jgi:rod shape-determining protein MreC
LRDQFETTQISAPDLLPAQIIGSPKSLPTEIPTTFVLDKGSRDGVKLGQTVVYKNNLVGKIVAVSQKLSTMIVVSNSSFVTAGKTAKSEAIGVIKGKGGDDITLDTVLLSEDLKTSDVVVTKGDINNKGEGVPPNLIVGKITSVDKKPSALFQSASVKSLLSFSKLSTVFIMLAYPK